MDERRSTTGSIETPHASHVYAPHRERKGIALCLSGGGFRAALFHLGALRRLNELDILSKVTTVTAVSGGSAVAAHLANLWDHWHAGPCPTDEWEREIAAPFRAFTSRNLSTPPALTGMRPWNLFNNAGVEALAKACEPLCEKNVQELPECPNFMFCATDLVTGTPFVFERSSDRQWTVGQAVAISSCFPGIFRPYTEKKPRYIALVDGGVADNRGVEPVWQTHETLLVSDGGDTLRPQWNQSIFWELTRSASVLLNQMQLVQKRWLLANMLSGATCGAYWGLGSVTSHYRTARHDRPERLSRPRPGASTQYLGYTPALVRDTIATIRLDFDVFSDAEAAVLENHGYLLADAATRTHLPRLRRPAPLRIPHPAWLSDQKVREALSESSHKLLLGRGAFRAVFGATPEPVASRDRVPHRTGSVGRRVSFTRPDGNVGAGIYVEPAEGANGAGVVVIQGSLAVIDADGLNRLRDRGYRVLVPDICRGNVDFGGVAAQNILGAVRYLEESCESVGVIGFRSPGALALLFRVSDDGRKWAAVPLNEDGAIANAAVAQGDALQRHLQQAGVDFTDDRSGALHPFAAGPLDIPSMLADAHPGASGDDWEPALALLDQHLGEPMSA